MATFVWCSDSMDKAKIVQAENREEAYRKVLNYRFQFESIEDAIAHFIANDQIYEVSDHPVDTSPWKGELPEEGC